MKLLIALIAALIILLLFENHIRKHPAIWYCSAFFLSLLCMFLPDTTPAWISRLITNYISRGTVATALFILVMYARVLPPKSRLFRTLMSLRAPLAITASFMILLHNVFYFIHYHNNAITRNIMMTPMERIAACCTMLMLLLLLPLTITSFTSVRKKMKGITWKKLQRLSYIFYGLIYLHVALLFGQQIAKGNTAYQIELAIYSAIFGIYLVCRVALYLKNTKKITASKYLRSIGIPVVSIISACMILINPIADSAQKSKSLTDTSEESTIPETASTALAESQEDTPIYQDGIWTGTAFGYNDDITVSVTIENGTITDISVIETADDEPFFDWAEDEVLPNIISTQSTQVDSVSGATFSSEGLKEAVKNALEQAK